MINNLDHRFERLSRVRGHRSVRGWGSINLIEINEAQGGHLLLLPLPSYFKSQLLFGRWERWQIEGWGRVHGRRRVKKVEAKVHSCAVNLMLRWKRHDTFFHSLHNFPTPPQKLKCCIFNGAVNNLHSMGKMTPFVPRCQKFFFVKYKKVARCKSFSGCGLNLSFALNLFSRLKTKLFPRQTSQWCYF